MDENALGTTIVDCSFHVHKSLGPGLLESVYEVALVHTLRQRSLKIERQVPIPIVFEDVKFDEGFRADVIVEDSVILELKSLEQVLPVHKKQLLTYLRLTDKRLGYLINFGESLIKDGIS